MPRKRQTPERPRDLNELAFRVGQIATHQVEDVTPSVNEAAAKRGRARAAKLTPAKRKKIAKKAANARWHGPSS